MGNKGLEVIKAYDLKGSLFGRKTKFIKGPLTILKDLNFLENTKDRMAVADE